jgi:hypothetical protein
MTRSVVGGEVAPEAIADAAEITRERIGELNDRFGDL